MAIRPASAESKPRQILIKLLASAAAVALLPACTPSFMKAGAEAPSLNLSEQPREALTPTNPLHKATAYWAGQYKKNPNDPTAALNYAKNLKAVGSKPMAISVLQQAHAKHPGHKEIASEYGRLLLESGKVQLALRTLKQAEQGDRTDWRVVAAQGTAHATLGEHETAQKYFAAALRKKPDSATLRNNLALSYAMSGSPDKAETLLRQTIAGGYDNARVRQNLALVLGMQGKYQESQTLAAVDLSKDAVASNVSYLRTLTKNKDEAREQLASQVTVASTGSYAPATVRVASAPDRADQRAQRPQPPTLLTSKTRPLPWRTETGAASAPVRTAEAKAVPLPPRKPSGPKAAPGPKPAAAPAPAVAANHAPLPWHQPRQAAPKKEVAVAAWSTRVIAAADEPKVKKAGP